MGQIKPCARFGYVVKVTLKENEPCQLDFENPDQTTCIRSSNSESEDLNKPSAQNSNYYAQSQQIADDFRFAAPPDCRVQLCRDDNDTNEDYDNEIKKV